MKFTKKMKILINKEILSRQTQIINNSLNKNDNFS